MRLCLCMLVLVGCAKARRAPSPPALPETRSGLAAASSSVPPGAQAAKPLAEPTPDGGSAAQASACQASDADACTTLAREVAPRGAFRVTLSKEEADRRVQLTARYALRGCELGSGESCALAARFDAYAHTDRHLTRACELGFVAACGTLGVRQFASDQPVEQRRQHAARVERACLANAQDDSAFTSEPGGFCHVLFDWYRERLLPRDRAAQARFLELACQQGYGLDCPCKSDDDCRPEHFCAGRRCAVISTH